ncbi:MAG: lytic transglycosylase domain-containing protein [bacterium]|nr:lytic transglycosylase domain-containing protein [bacterium]
MKYLLMICLSFAAALFLFQESSHARESFYTYKDSNGVIHFSNIRSDVRFKPLSGPGSAAANSDGSLDGIHRTIERVSMKYSVDSRLVKAIVKAESSFDPYAVSYAGAKGLMQLMPQTARELNVDNPFDPVQSIDGGVRYFKRLLKLFEYDVKLALAAYNAGRTTVLRYGGVPPYKQTRDYVKKVLRFYDEYKRL